MRAGHEVTLVSATEDHLYGFKPPDDVADRSFSFSDEGGVPFCWIPASKSSGRTVSRIWNMVTFGRHLRNLPQALGGKRPDLIYGSSPHLFAAYFSCRLAKEFGVPFVLEIRDIWPESFVELGRVSRWHPFIILLRMIEKHVYRQADRIVTLLPGSVDHIAASGGERSRIAVIPNGVDLELIPEPKPRERNDEPFTVMYAGAHSLANGLDVVLDAAREVEKSGGERGVRFVLVGDGTEKAKLKERVRTEGIGNVFFEPRVPKERVFGKLAEADAFIMCMHDTPLYEKGVSPNKIFDYMASARPIIFAARARNNPIAEAKAGVVVEPNDVDGVVRAVGRLRDMRAKEREELGCNGRRYVEERHAFTVLGGRLRGILEELVTPGAASGMARERAVT